MHSEMGLVVIAACTAAPVAGQLVLPQTTAHGKLGVPKDVHSSLAKRPQESEDGSVGAIVSISKQLKAQFLLTCARMTTFV